MKPIPNTLEDIRNMTCDFLVPAQVASILGTDPQLIRCVAKSCPEKLGFPVIVLGSRTKIPRKAFVKFMDGDANVV